jgi:hypothetical protein
VEFCGYWFFYPVELHLQPPDLLVERRLHHLLVLQAPATEDLLGLRPELALPLADLRWMHPYPATNSFTVLNPLRASKATFALNSPLCRLRLVVIIRPPSNHRISYLTGGPKFGVHYTLGLASGASTPWKRIRCDPRLRGDGREPMRRVVVGGIENLGFLGIGLQGFSERVAGAQSGES